MKQAIASLLGSLMLIAPLSAPTSPMPRPDDKAANFRLLFDDISDPDSIGEAARLGCERLLIVYQMVDPGAQTKGLIDPAVLVEAIQKQAKDGLPDWGMLDFETPFYELLAEGPDSPRFAATVETMIGAIRAVRTAFPGTKWCYYGMPQVPYWIGPKHDQNWVTAPEEMKRSQLQRIAKICAPIVAEMDWVSPSIYAVYDPSLVKHSPESVTRTQGRAWRFTSTGIAKLLAHGKPVIPMACPWWTPGGTAPFCRVIPVDQFIEDIAAPAIDAGANGIALWTCMTYQINRVTASAADESKYGHEANFGTPEWRNAVVLDYFDGKAPGSWTDPAVRSRLVRRMSEAAVNALRGIRARESAKQTAK